MRTGRLSSDLRRFAAVPLLLLMTGAAAAQTTHSTSNAFGFTQNRKDPIKIESVSLEVRDKEKIATFVDNVRLVQGDTTLECKRLVVFYDDEITPGSGNAKKGKSSEPAPASSGQQVRRLEARGGVVVTQKDQIATGDHAVYDMKTNSIVITGAVVLTQGANVVTGDKLYVDMATGVSTVESRPAAGQSTPPVVRALINPNSARETPKPAPANAKPSGASPDRVTGTNPERTGSSGSDKDKPKQSPARPLKLN